jgi:phytoene/squalene synthetase
VAINRDGIAFICPDVKALEQYCHYVAGTVGIMSTALFETRLKPLGLSPGEGWREDGRRLGLGLQMTNIIKDCRVDAQRGVSFIPPDFVASDGSSYRLASPFKLQLMSRCIGHLDAGLRYSLAIPRSETGIRTFLLGSLLPAIATLEVAAPGTEMHPKIDRAKMAEIFECITADVGDDDALRNWYNGHRERTLRLALT